MSWFFYYSLTFSSYGNVRVDSQYTPDNLYLMAGEIPDFTRDLFRNIRQDFDRSSASIGFQNQDTCHFAPCVFHDHPLSDLELQYPRDLGDLMGEPRNQSSTASRLLYSLETGTLHGDFVSYISQGHG